MMQKYYYVQWPQSKRFMKNKQCIQGDGMNYFVPCEIYDELMSQPKG